VDIIHVTCDPDGYRVMEEGKSSARGRVFRIITTAATVLISAGILGYMIYSQRAALETFTWDFRVVPVVLGFLVFSLDLLLVAVIWGWIMNTIGKPLPLRTHLRVYLISNVAKRLPGTIWYVASRAQMYKEEQISRRFTSLASGVEFTISMISSAMVCFFFAVPTLAQYRLGFFGIGSVFVIGLVLVHPRFINWSFRKLGTSAREFTYWKSIQWLLAYLLAWFLSGLFIYQTGTAILPIAPQNLWYIIGSIGLVNLLAAVLFFAPSNLGVTEVGLSLLLSNLVPAPIAVIIAIAVRVLVIVFEIIWALLAIWLL
jgi:uncharacterized membrane protein YbhN (UPF0104 family)